MFGDAAPSREAATWPRSTRSTGRGSWPRSSTTSRAALALGAPWPQGRVRRADRQFRRRLCRLRGAADGPADRRSWSSRPTATTSWRASSPAATTARARSMPTISPSMDIQVASNFERLLFDLCGRDGAAVRALMAEFAAQRQPRSPETRSAARASCSMPRAVDEDDDRGDHGGCPAGDRRAGRSAHRGRASPPAAACRRDPDVPLVAWRPRIRPSFPTRSQRRDRHPAAAAAAPRRSARAARALRGAAQRLGGRAPTTSAAAAHGDRMSEPTRDHDPRQRPSRRDRDHGQRADRERRRLGRRRRPLRGARGQRRRPHARAHGLQGHRAPLGARHRRGDRERRRPAQRLHLARAHRLLRPRAGRRPAARRRPPRRHPAALDLRRDELARERSVVLQEIGQVQDTPDDLVFDLFQETRLSRASRSAARSSGRRRSWPRCRATALVDYMAQPLRPVAHGAGGRRQGRARPAGRARRAAVPRAADARAAAAAPRPLRRRRAARAARPGAGALLLGCRPSPRTTTTSTRSRCCRRCSAAACPRACSRRSARTAASAYSIFSFASGYADTGLLGIYAGTGEKETAELDPGGLRRDLASWSSQPGEDELARARAQLKASLMMALESCFAQSEELARQLLVFGRRIPPDEIIAKIEAVDQAAIRRVGRRLLAAAPRRSPRSARSPTSPTSTRSPAGCGSAGIANRSMRKAPGNTRRDCG